MLAFDGARGDRLAGRLDTPGEAPRAVVLVAHCFGGGNDGPAAAAFARGFAERGMAVLSLDCAADGASGLGADDLIAAAGQLRADLGAPAVGQRITVGGHELAADEPASVGGADTGPSPYELLLASLGACTAITVRMYADRKGWPLRNATVRLRHERIHARDCADCETGTGMLDHIERQIHFDGDLTGEQRARLMDMAGRCPVHRTLHSEIHVSTTEA
jgi:uncharacterized OsmC-like protein